jgi:uncharacterized cupredoxin-like copper-binding protein
VTRRCLFSPSRIEVRQGEQIKLVLTNAAYLDHEFMIATPEEDRKHAELMKKYWIKMTIQMEGPSKPKPNARVS